MRKIRTSEKKEKGERKREEKTRKRREREIEKRERDKNADMIIKRDGRGANDHHYHLVVDHDDYPRIKMKKAVLEPERTKE